MAYRLECARSLRAVIDAIKKASPPEDSPVWMVAETAVGCVGMLAVHEVERQYGDETMLHLTRDTFETMGPSVQYSNYTPLSFGDIRSAIALYTRGRAPLQA